MGDNQIAHGHWSASFRENFAHGAVRIQPRRTILRGRATHHHFTYRSRLVRAPRSTTDAGDIRNGKAQDRVEIGHDYCMDRPQCDRHCLGVTIGTGARPSVSGKRVVTKDVPPFCDRRWGAGRACCAFASSRTIGRNACSRIAWWDWNTEQIDAGVWLTSARSMRPEVCGEVRQGSAESGGGWPFLPVTGRAVVGVDQGSPERLLTPPVHPD